MTLNTGGVILVASAERGVLVAARPGKDPPQLSGGVGGTTTIDVPRDTAAVHWETHPPYRMSVQLLLDGFEQGRSVENECLQVLKLSRAERGEARPPTVTLAGPLPRTDLKWLVDGLEWSTDDDELIRRNDGHRVRQAVTLQLVQDNRPRVVEVGRAAAKRRGGARVHVVARGDTLAKIAIKFKVPGGWKALAKLNKIRDPKAIKVGQRIKLP